MVLYSFVDFYMLMLNAHLLEETLPFGLAHDPPSFLGLCIHLL